MSAKSDAHEKLVAKAINALPGMTASRPSVSVSFSDVKITKFNNKPVKQWLEVKMSHSDNLSNPRAFYKQGKWQTTYKTPVAKFMIIELNKSAGAAKWILDIAKFAFIDPSKVVIPTTKKMLEEPGAIPLEAMKAFFNRPGINRYITRKANTNLGKLVTEHYVVGKAEPTYYMQAADDFYRISNKNPLKLNSKIPILSGHGEFKVRISTRTKFYEVQAEVKIEKMPNSLYSLIGSKKTHPFIEESV